MRGGFRSGARRPKGSKNKPALPPYRHSGGTLSKEQIADVRERAVAWLAENEASLLQRIMNSNDLRLQFECYRFVKGYGDGLAPKSIDVNVHASFESLMAEVVENAKKREALTVSVVDDSQTASTSLVLLLKN